MKTFISLLTLVVLSSASIFGQISEEHYKYKVAKKIFDKLLLKNENKFTLFQIDTSKQFACKYNNEKRVLILEEQVYDIATTFGVDSLNFLAFILARQMVLQNQFGFKIVEDKYKQNGFSIRDSSGKIIDPFKEEKRVARNFIESIVTYDTFCLLEKTEFSYPYFSIRPFLIEVSNYYPKFKEIIIDFFNIEDSFSSSLYEKKILLDFSEISFVSGNNSLSESILQSLLNENHCFDKELVKRIYAKMKINEFHFYESIRKSLQKEKYFSIGDYKAIKTTYDGLLKEALELIEKSTSVDNPITYIILGEIFLAKKDYETALIYLGKPKELSYDSHLNKIISLYLGILYYNTDLTKANSFFEKALIKDDKYWNCVIHNFLFWKFNISYGDKELKILPDSLKKRNLIHIDVAKSNLNPTYFPNISRDFSIIYYSSNTISFKDLNLNNDDPITYNYACNNYPWGTLEDKAGIKLGDSLKDVIELYGSLFNVNFIENRIYICYRDIIFILNETHKVTSWAGIPKKKYSNSIEKYPNYRFPKNKDLDKSDEWNGINILLVNPYNICEGEVEAEFEMMTFEAKIESEVPIEKIWIDSTLVTLDEKGYFTHNVSLSPGENTIEMSVKQSWGKPNE